ncbi:Ribonuclease H1 [Coemansia sp. RSA 1972]|nr:Ribonuclease H1 [Coemansia sp. RSA 1972]
MTVIYVDGSCINNGQPNASAGIGVYFGPGDSRNYSGKMDGKQTSQRAELEAIRQALVLLESFPRCGSGHRDVVIRTDSEMALLGVKKVQANSGCALANLDIINNIVNRMNTSGYNVSLQKVAGHSGDPGNDKAHELAIAAARR